MSIHVFHQDAPLGAVDLTVPDNQSWTILYGHVIYSTSAVVGQRWVVTAIELPDNDILNDSHAGDKQLANTVRQYSIKPGISTATAFNDVDMEIGIPARPILLPGWHFRVRDTNEIDANDTVSLHLVYEQTGSRFAKR